MVLAPPATVSRPSRLASLDNVERHALVLGIGRYMLPELQLSMPEQDATKVASRLAELNWIGKKIIC